MTQTQANAQNPKSPGNWFEDTALWKLKVRVQFSGWLQYLVHAVVVVLMLLLAGIGWLIGYWPVLLVWLPLGIAAVLFVPLIGSILIVKYGLHPTESLPANKTGLGAFDLIRARRSCRSFQSRDFTPEHHAELMEVVRANSEPKRQLGQRPIRFEYVAAPLTVWPVVGAHEFLIAIAPHEYNRLSVIDIGRSLQKVVLHATRMGLATCWIGPGADQKGPSTNRLTTHFRARCYKERGARVSHGIAWISLAHERVEGTTRLQAKGAMPPGYPQAMLGTVGHKSAKYFLDFDFAMSRSRP